MDSASSDELPRADTWRTANTRQGWLVVDQFVDQVI